MPTVGGAQRAAVNATRRARVRARARRRPPSCGPAQASAGQAASSCDKDLLKRPLNEGFSGGEKKRNEIFQMGMLAAQALAILDEPDSGLDVDALQDRRSTASTQLRNEERAIARHHPLPAPARSPPAPSSPTSCVDGRIVRSRGGRIWRGPGRGLRATQWARERGRRRERPPTSSQVDWAYARALSEGRRGLDRAACRSRRLMALRADAGSPRAATRRGSTRGRASCWARPSRRVTAGPSSSPLDRGPRRPDRVRGWRAGARVEHRRGTRAGRRGGRAAGRGCRAVGGHRGLRGAEPGAGGGRGPRSTWPESTTLAPGPREHRSRAAGPPCATYHGCPGGPTRARGALPLRRRGGLAHHRPHCGSGGARRARAPRARGGRGRGDPAPRAGHRAARGGRRAPLDPAWCWGRAPRG